jgi:hypothetical protein
MVGCFALQDCEPGVVVRKLRQVRESDLSGNDRIVAADVGLWTPRPMLEFDVKPQSSPSPETLCLSKPVWIGLGVAREDDNPGRVAGDSAVDALGRTNRATIARCAD